MQVNDSFASPGNVSQCEITGYIGLDLLPFFENNLSSGEVLRRTTNHPPLPPEKSWLS